MTPLLAVARQFGRQTVDDWITELLRRIQSGQTLTLAEYVRAEECMAPAQPVRVEDATGGRNLCLRMQL